jgi:hypothetical protein
MMDVIPPARENDPSDTKVIEMVINKFPNKQLLPANKKYSPVKNRETDNISPEFPEYLSYTYIKNDNNENLSLKLSMYFPSTNQSTTKNKEQTANDQTSTALNYYGKSQINIHDSKRISSISALSINKRNIILKPEDIPIDWHVSIFQDSLSHISLSELRSAPSEEEIMKDIWRMVNEEIGRALSKHKSLL